MEHNWLETSEDGIAVVSLNGYSIYIYYKLSNITISSKTCVRDYSQALQNHFHMLPSIFV